MKVKELIEFLKKQDQDMHVVRGLYSEQCLLDEDSIEVCDFCEPRPDGWVENARPDQKSVKYLLIHGN